MGGACLREGGCTCSSPGATLSEELVTTRALGHWHVPGATGQASRARPSGGSQVQDGHRDLAVDNEVWKWDMESCGLEAYDRRLGRLGNASTSASRQPCKWAGGDPHGPRGRRPGPGSLGQGTAEPGTSPSLDAAQACAPPPGRPLEAGILCFSCCRCIGPVGQEGVTCRRGWILGDTSLWSWRWEWREGLSS